MDMDPGLLARNDQLEKELADLRGKFFEALKFVRLGALGTTCDSCGAKPSKHCYGNGPMWPPHQGRHDKAARELEELLAEAADVV